MTRAALATSMLVLCSCAWEGWAHEPDPTWARMFDQPRVDAYEPGARWRPPAGTVAYRRSTAPAPLDRALVERGRRLFDVHCAPCHGVAGDGDSVVAEDMQERRPPSLLETGARALSDRDIESIVAQGYGLMPSYARALDDEGRRAVVLYVRALQLRDSMPVAALEPALRRELEEQAP